MNREILRLAIPNILSNLSVPLLGLVDTALMGHLDNAERFLSAIAIASAIFNILYWSFGFLRMGTTGLTAQAYGAQREQEAFLTLGRGLMVAMVGGIILVVCQHPIGWAGMEIMEGSEDAKNIARSYFDIRIFAAPAALGMYVFNGWFLGMQNAIVPLILSIVINVVNIGANFIFVVGYGMDAEGIALGTVIAQYTGLILAGILFLRRYKGFLKYRKEGKMLDPAQLRRFLLVNRDIFIRTACLIFAFTYFTAASGRFSDEVLAANALLLQLLYLMSYLVDGIAYAAESLVGKYMGEGSPDGLRKLVRRLLVWGMGFGAVFSLIYLLGGPFLLTLLSDKEEVIAIAVEYLPWMILMPIWGTYSFLWDGIFIGATASVSLRNTMILAVFGGFLPTWWLTQGWGNHGLWLAMTMFMLLRGVGLAVMSGKIYKKAAKA